MLCSRNLFPAKHFTGRATNSVLHKTSMVANGVLGSCLPHQRNNETQCRTYDRQKNTNWHIIRRKK